jgi:hypothetical protein
MSDSKQNDRMDSTVRTEQIAERAYLLYLARGAQDGHDLEDWFQAELQLRQESKTPTAA